jgi:RNA polymerase sigma factor (sigma-70 family)
MPRSEITLAMLAAARAGDRDAQGQVVLGMEAAAKAVALWFIRHYQDAALDMDDLIQEGLMSVLRTIQRYDPSRGEATFSTYAYEGIMNACRKHAGKERRHAANEVPETDVLARDDGREPVRGTRGTQPGGDRRPVGLDGEDRRPQRAGPSLQAVPGLDQTGAAVVALRLEPVRSGQAPLPWRTIARRLRLSPERVRELYAATITLIREAHGVEEGD